MQSSITPLGDSALLVHVCRGFEHDAERCLEAVLNARARLEAAALPGVIEITPALMTLGVFFDPARLLNPEDEIAHALGGAATRSSPTTHPGSAGCQPAAFGSLPNASGAATPAARRSSWQAAANNRRAACAPRRGSNVVEVPICYDEEFALDLAEVAQHSNLTVAEVISCHVRATYRVRCVGFTPGFPYLSGLPAELAMPRRATPRKAVEAGAVAIGGHQTGIYPQASPGGWNIIGRTPLRLFDPAATRPAFFTIGNTVRFRAVTRAEFDALSA